MGGVKELSALERGLVHRTGVEELQASNHPLGICPQYYMH
jgi:hypothetical protein